MTLLFTLLLSGCSSKDKDIAFPSDSEILQKVTPYLSDTVKQDLSQDIFLEANLGLTSDDVLNPVLYMGMPNQNTTYFCMFTLVEKSHIQEVKEHLTLIMENWVDSAEQGYLSGSSAYEIIQKGDKIFVIMHEDANSFNELVAYINSLPE